MAEIDSLSIHISATSTQADKALSKLASTLRTLNGAVQATNMSKLVSPLSKLSQAGSYSDVLAKAIVKANVFARAAQRVASGIMGIVGQSNKYIESLNLFTASMGKYADAAQHYAERVSDVMGIDTADWLESQGVFMTLATGFGIAGDRAQVMSQQLTQLGYDISSYFNLPVEKAMQKLQSGFSGELEPLRRLGYDLSQARLKQVAWNLGIEENFDAMTQAEKAQLRYYAIMTQVTTAQGDMARTLDSPANAMRVLKAQVEMAGREIGNIFIPMLNAIVPVATAVVRAVRAVAAAIASLFGFTLPSVDYSGIQGTVDATDSLDDSLQSAGGSAKKLKNYLMKFDELNVIDPSSGGGGGGGGGAGIPDNWDFELPTYDFLDGLIGSKVDAIYAKMKPFVDWLTENIGDVLTVVKAIGAAFLAWKLADDFIFSEGALQTIFGKFLGGLVLAGTMVANIALQWSFASDFTKEDGTIVDLLAQGGTAAAFSGLIGLELAKLLGDSFLGSEGKNFAFGFGISMAASAVVSLASEAITTTADGITWKTIGESLLAVIEGTAAGAALAFALGASVVGGAVLGGTFTLAAALVIALTSAYAHSKLEAQENAWGDVELTAEEVAAKAQSFFNIDVDATISLISTSIKDKENAVESLNTAIAGLDDSLLPLKVGCELDPDDYNKVLVALQGADGTGGLIAKINTALEANGKIIRLGVGFGITGMDGTDVSGNVMEATRNSISATNAIVEDLGRDLATLLAKGFDVGLTDAEKAMVSSLSESISRISAAVVSGRVKASADADFAIRMVDIDRGSFIQVMDVVTQYRDELKVGFTDAAKEMSVGLATTLASNEQAFSELLAQKKNFPTLWTAEKEAELLQAQEAFNAAKAAYESFDINEQVATWVSNAVSDKRSEVLEASQNATNSRRDRFSVHAADDYLYHQLRMDNLFGNATATAVDIRDLIDNLLFKSVGWDSYNAMQQANDVFGTTNWDHLGTEARQTFFDSISRALTNFDSTEVAEMFKSAGYDLGGLVIDGVVQGMGDSSTDKDVSTTLDNAADTIDSETYKQAGVDAATAAAEGMESVDMPELAASASVTVGDITSENLQTQLQMQNYEMSATVKLKADSSTTVQSQLGLDKLTGKVTRMQKAPGFNNVLDGITARVTKMVNAVNASTAPAAPVAMAASGGAFSTGEMFVAREAGPELVGRIGSKSAVMNNDQIVQAVSAGVYSAVLSAMQESNQGDRTVTVNLDGKAIYENQRKVARNRGYDLGMGVMSFG